MVVAGTRFRLAQIPVERIVVTEHQARYPARVLHYHQLLTEHPERHLSMIHLAPYRPDGGAPDGGSKHTDAGLWQILDGHHRYLAHVLAGRTHVLALLISEPGWPSHAATEGEPGWMEVMEVMGEGEEVGEAYGDDAERG